MDKVHVDKIKERFQQMEEQVVRKEPGRLNAMLRPKVCEYDETVLTTVIRFQKQPWQRNQRGELHGGSIAAMFDTAMGMSVVAFSGNAVSTADLSVSYIRPFLGESFLFRSKILHLGKNLVRVRAEAYDQHTEKCLASASGNFVYVRS